MRCTFLPLKARHMTKKVQFKIDHMDPLGQGVSKISDKIVFIPSTLPGEEGEAEILKESKGVAFAKLIHLTKKSPDRIKPQCPHFETCNGCHYLHTDYNHELNFKKNSLQKDFQKFEECCEVETLKAPSRLAYRNRVQLHYNKKIGLIGFHGYKSNRIIDAKNCQIFDPSMKEVFDDTIQNFQSLLKGEPLKGHIEIYLNGNEVKRTFNKPYSEGGFSQVNKEMNQRALDLISNQLEDSSTEGLILDLFGGSGNLTRGQKNSTLVVDIYPKDKTEGHQSFLNLDLFNENSLDEIIETVDRRAVTHLVIDPPRSGFKQLEEYVEAFRPQKIVYMSCKPSTMSRDVIPLQENYKMQKLVLLDFFPSTFHYEGLIVLERKTN
ncbi:MAG: class I SAM-dependent RNA methyltransferase [Deltaproteobacteria bacterium]|nr:MAG: class I SAM-dependent RNA methyltransferase [Deltaproteobacteria bacterium]